MKKNIIIVLAVAFIANACNELGINPKLTYTGRIIEKSGTPIANADVTISNGEESRAETTTAMDGTFTINVNLEEINGDYQLYISYQDFSTSVQLFGYGTGGRDLGDIVLYDKSEYYHAPQVSTSYLYSATESSIVCGGIIKDVSAQTSPIIEYGLCLYETSMPNLTADTIRLHEDLPIGEFSYTLHGLDLANKSYKIKAFATNEIGTTYGDERIANKENLQYESLPTVQIDGQTYHIFIPNEAEVSYPPSLEHFASFDDWCIPSKELLYSFIGQDESILNKEMKYWASGANIFYYDEGWKVTPESQGMAVVVAVRHDLK